MFDRRPERRERGGGAGTRRWSVAFRWALAFAVVMPAMACGGRPATVSLRMAGSPPFALVTIDDEAVGSLAFVASRGVALPPGRHHVSVEAPGYFPWDGVVEAKEGQGPVKVDIALTPIPD